MDFFLNFRLSYKILTVEELTYLLDGSKQLMRFSRIIITGVVLRIVETYIFHQKQYTKEKTTNKKFLAADEKYDH